MISHTTKKDPATTNISRKITFPNPLIKFLITLLLHPHHQRTMRTKSSHLILLLVSIARWCNATPLLRQAHAVDNSIVAAEIGQNDHEARGVSAGSVTSDDDDTPATFYERVASAYTDFMTSWSHAYTKTASNVEDTMKTTAKTSGKADADSRSDDKVQAVNDAIGSSQDPVHEALMVDEASLLLPGFYGAEEFRAIKDKFNTEFKVEVIVKTRVDELNHITGVARSEACMTNTGTEIAAIEDIKVAEEVLETKSISLKVGVTSWFKGAQGSEARDTVSTETDWQVSHFVVALVDTEFEPVRLDN